MTMLTVMLLAGAGTYLLRASMILAMDRFDPGPMFEERLALIGPAAVAALLASALFTNRGGMSAPEIGALLALGVGAGVSRRSGNVALALGVGLPVYWLTQAIPF